MPFGSGTVPADGCPWIPRAITVPFGSPSISQSASCTCFGISQVQPNALCEPGVAGRQRWSRFGDSKWTRKFNGSTVSASQRLRIFSVRSSFGNVVRGLQQRGSRSDPTDPRFFFFKSQAGISGSQSVYLAWWWGLRRASAVLTRCPSALPGGMPPNRSLGALDGPIACHV